MDSIVAVPTTYITSDLHLGSKHCLVDRFAALLDAIADDSRLVMNGDSIDDPYQKLPGHHQWLLDKIIAAAQRLDIVWVEGNHDEGYRLPGTEAVHYCREFNIDGKLLVCHGHDFDNVTPYHGWFTHLFRILHDLRIKLGASPVHIAHYAKRWSLCYGYFRKNIMMNAIEHCREHNFATVACGHVHYAEEVTVDGVRYINTGSWTESGGWYIRVDAGGVVLCSADSDSPTLLT